MGNSQHDDKDWQSTKKTVLERSCHMFGNPFLSDFEFTWKGSDKKIMAHKYLLATSSSVFHRMFYGKLAENKSVHLSDTDEKSFTEFLRYLYTDKCHLTTDNVVSILSLGKQYNVPALAQECFKFLEENLVAGNAFTVLQYAILFEDKELEGKSWELIDLKTNEAVDSEAFTKIDQATLAKLLERESLSIKEVELFNAVLKWTEVECSRKELEANSENKRAVLGTSIHDIRFGSMTLEEFARITSDSDLLKHEEMVFFYQKLGGIERTSEIWKMSARTGILLRCSRFGGHGSLSFKEKQIEHAIGVSFSRPVKIHGVHLLGNAGDKYNVRLEVCSQQSQVIENTFDGQLEDRRSVSGFDVMFPVSVPVETDVTVPLKATITDMKHVFIYHGTGGKKQIETNGVTVTFSNIKGAHAGITTVEKGQFDQIIFSLN